MTETVTFADQTAATLSTVGVSLPNTSTPGSFSAQSLYSVSGKLNFGSSATATAILDISGLTAARTLSLPDSSDTMVTDNSVATLTNKTIPQGSNTLSVTKLSGASIDGTCAVGLIPMAISAVSAPWSAPGNGVSQVIALNSTSTYTNAIFTNLTTLDGTYRYEGNVLNAAIFVLYASNSSTTQTVRVRDVTNSTTICSVTTTSNNQVATAATNIGNLSMATATWQIQVARNSGSGTTTFAGAVLYFT